VAVEMRSALSTPSPPSFISLRRSLSLVLPVGCGAVSALPALDPLWPLAAQLPTPVAAGLAGYGDRVAFSRSHRARALRRPTLVEVRQMQRWGSSDPRPTGC
jgi:hypothetical protein